MGRKKPPFLGKIPLKWCFSCNLPVLGKICSRCGEKTQSIQISPPGDARLALAGDLDLLNQALQSFGSQAAVQFMHSLKNKIVIFNKSPYEDRMDEVIADGICLGNLRFNLARNVFEFVPRLEGAQRLYHKGCKKTVVADIGAKESITKGASVLRPGILDADPDIQIDEPVIVICEGEVIATGLAKVSGREMTLPEKKGVGVKTKHRGILEKNLVLPGGQSLQELYLANENIILNMEIEALEFISRLIKEFKDYAVAYSGGKDSLAVLLLALDVDDNCPVFFADTGLEFPETLENIKIVEQELGIKIHTNHASTDEFWYYFERFGPPARESRWCCKRSKLNPINNLLAEMFPNATKEKGVLSFIGRRRYESFARSKEARVSHNPWIPLQVGAAPILNWTALHLYLYFYKKKALHLLNPLYEKGFIRIGCWLCPACSKSDLFIIQKIHPELMTQLDKAVEKWAKYIPRSDIWQRWALWRWKQLPKKILDLLDREGIKKEDLTISLEKERTEALSFEMTTTLSPCKSGGYSIYVRASDVLDLTQVQNLLLTIGSPRSSKNLGIVVVQVENGQATVHANGEIRVQHSSPKQAKKLLQRVLQVIIRAEECDLCGTCIPHCQHQALVIEQNKIKVKDNCQSCAKCADACPIWRFSYQDTQTEISRL